MLFLLQLAQEGEWGGGKGSLTGSHIALSRPLVSYLDMHEPQCGARTYPGSPFSWSDPGSQDRHHP